MTDKVPILPRLVGIAVKASEKAGEIIRDVKSRGELNIVEKKKNDYQTEADRSAQRCIVASLTKQFPEIKIIGEEELPDCDIPTDWIVTDVDQEVLKVNLPAELENVKVEDLCVWVDPVDATREYVEGDVEKVTVLVGVAVKDRAIGGVIHQPYFKNPQDGSLGRTLWGIAGAGIGGFKPCPLPYGKRIITTTRPRYDSAVQATLDAMEPDEIVRANGAGYKVLLLLDGKAHAFFYANRSYKRWDICAPDAVLHAAGGSFTNLEGEKYSYNSTTEPPIRKGVMATAPCEDYQWYFSRVPSEIRARVTD